MPNKKIKTFVFDVDDTLLQYTSGLRDYVNQYYGLDVQGLPEHYSLRDWIPREDFERKDMLKRFNKAWQFGCLPPLSGAVETINKILELNKNSQEPIELVALTKCGKDPITVALRKANLTHVFGVVFNEVIIIDGQESKKHYLKKLMRHREILLSVDDFVGNIVDMVDLGVPSVIISQPHNKDVAALYADIPREDTWEDIFKRYILPQYQDGQ